MWSNTADVVRIVEYEIGTRRGAESQESWVIFLVHQRSALGKSVAHWRSQVVWASVEIFSCCLKRSFESLPRKGCRRLTEVAQREEVTWLCLVWLCTTKATCIYFGENKFGNVSVSYIKTSNLNYSSGHTADKMAASTELGLCQCTNWDLRFSERWKIWGVSTHSRNFSFLPWVDGHVPG